MYNRKAEKAEDGTEVDVLNSRQLSGRIKLNV